MALRGAMRKTHSLDGLATKPLSIAEREKLLREALRNDELATVIMEAGTNFPRKPQLPKAPVQPSFESKLGPPPKVPHIPSKSELRNNSSLARRTKSAVEDYKREISNWKKEAANEKGIGIYRGLPLLMRRGLNCRHPQRKRKPCLRTMQTFAGASLMQLEAGQHKRAPLRAILTGSFSITPRIPCGS